MNNGYHIDLKMMMEGIEVPFRSVVVSCTPNGIEMNVDVHPSDIVMALKPKTSVQIFYKDWIGAEQDKKWRLLCDAYFSAYGKTDSTIQGGHRGLTLMCRDLRMDIRKTPSTMIYAEDDMDLGGTQRKFASVNGLSFTKTNKGDIDAHSFGAADSLRNFSNIIQYMISISSGKFADLTTNAADGRYVLEAFSRGVWMDSVSLAPYSASINSRARIDKKIVIPKNDAGFSFLSEQYMGQLIKGIVYGNSMFSSVEAVMMRVAAIFQAFPYSCSTPNIIDLENSESDLFLSKDVKSMIQKDSTFGYKALLNSCMILPPLNFTAPPNCNIIFPGMATQIDWNRDIDADPTRGHFDVNRIFDDMTDDNARRAWAISREIPAANIDFYAKNNAKVKGHLTAGQREEMLQQDTTAYFDREAKKEEERTQLSNKIARQRLEISNDAKGIKTEKSKTATVAANASKPPTNDGSTPAAAPKTTGTNPTESALADKGTAPTAATKSTTSVKHTDNKPKSKADVNKKVAAVTGVKNAAATTKDSNLDSNGEPFITHKGVAGEIYGVKAYLSVEERYSGVNVMYGSIEMYSMMYGQKAFLKDKFIDGTEGANNLAKINADKVLAAKLSKLGLSDAEKKAILNQHNAIVEKQKNYGPTINDMAYRHAYIKYMNGRTSSRSVSVQMDFNPYIVSGFPSIILVPVTDADSSSSMKHLYGMVQTVRHTASASGEATTSVSLTAVRFLDEPSKINDNGDPMYCVSTDSSKTKIDANSLRYLNPNYSIRRERQKAEYELYEPEKDDSVFAYDIRMNEDLRGEPYLWAADLLLNDGDAKANYSYMDVDYTPFRVGKFYEEMFGQKASSHFMVGRDGSDYFMYDTIHEAAYMNLISDEQLMGDYETAIRYIRRNVVDEFNFYVKVMGASYRIMTKTGIVYTNVADHIASAIDYGDRGFDRWFGFPDLGYGYPDLEKLPINPWNGEAKYPGDLSSIVENRPITPFIEEKRKVVEKYKAEVKKRAYTAAR